MTALKPHGALSLSEPRELTAARSLSGTYELDGTVAQDTLRLFGEAGEQRWQSKPPHRLTEPVIGAHEEPVVWAGGMLAHYGHFVLESASRLWPLLPGAELEGLPAVFATPLEHERADEWLDAFGARRVDLPEEGAVRFKRMHVPEPAYRIDAWMAPEIHDVHLHARRNLDVRAAPRGGVLWLSRSRLTRRRRPHDECLLEWILDDHVTILHPETKALGDQLAAIEASDAVAGVIGSAFHSLLMAIDPPDCVYLCPDVETTHGATAFKQPSPPRTAC